MTRKHFKELAYYLRMGRPNKKYSAKMFQWRTDRENIMTVCRHFNHNFDSDKFIRATEV